MRYDDKDIGLFSDEAPEENKPKKNKKRKKKVKITENQFKRLFKEDYYDNRKPVDGYVDSDDLVGEHIWVHTNRTHRNNGWNGMIGIYDVTAKGRKAGKAGRYTNEVRLKSPIYFQTSEKGAEGIRKSAEDGNTRRVLIAGVSGIAIPTEGDLSDFVEISYSPFDPGYFFIVGDDSKKEVVGASEVYFKASEDGDWVIMAKDIKFNETLNENVTSKPSFDDLYSSLYQPMFNNVCRKYTKDNDKAQEYCQEGFIKVWKNFDKYDGKGSIGAWVSSVIRNTILDIIRKESKMKFNDSGEDSFDFSRIGNQDDTDYKELNKSMSDVRRALRELSPQYQKVFTLYFIDNLTHNEISDELGISVGTSKSNLSKAKKKIQSILGKDIYTEQEDEGGSGESSTPSGGGSVWSSGASSYGNLTRGKANPIGNTVWSSGVSRGPGNPL